MNTTSLINNNSCIIYRPSATQHAKRENLRTSKAKNLDQFFFFECFTSQSMTESMFVEFLHDIMKHATSRSVIVFSPITSVKLCLGKASGLSILLPMTSNGIPVKEGLLRRSWSSLLAIAMFSRSAASTTYLQEPKTFPMVCKVNYCHQQRKIK